MLLYKVFPYSLLNPRKYGLELMVVLGRPRFVEEVGVEFLRHMESLGLVRVSVWGSFGIGLHPVLRLRYA